MSETLQRFAFDLDFGSDASRETHRRAAEFVEVSGMEAKRRSEPEPEAAPAEPPAPTYDEAALAEARSQAYAEGRTAGRVEARRASEERLILAVEGLAKSLNSLGSALKADRKASEAAAAGTAFVLVRRLFPQLAARYGAAEMEELLSESLRGLRNEPRAVVRVADEQLDLLREHIETLSERTGFDGKLVLLADETLAGGDLRVEWANGGAERSAGRLWQEAEDRFLRAFDLAPDTAARRDPPPVTQAPAEMSAADAQNDDEATGRHVPDRTDES